VGFTEVEWQRLHMLAETVERYFEGRLDLLGEIRLNESLLGATAVDRLRARVKIVDDGVAPVGTGSAPKRSRSRPDPRLAIVK
jgi:hypothetical protein